MPITIATLEDAAVELNRRAAVATPLDARRAQWPPPTARPPWRYVLNSLVDNAELRSPTTADVATPLPRYYVKVGNAAQTGWLRRVRAHAAQGGGTRNARGQAAPIACIRSPARIRNNVACAPNIDYRFHPDGD
jgi:hypothetical protein